MVNKRAAIVNFHPGGEEDLFPTNILLGKTVGFSSLNSSRSVLWEHLADPDKWIGITVRRFVSVGQRYRHNVGAANDNALGFLS
jgi:hypothetical protein